MPINLVILSVLGVLTVTAVLRVATRAEKSRVARFDKRTLLSFRDLQMEYFPEFDEDSVAECLSAIGKITGIEAGKLRPTDRFDVELKLPRGNFIAGEWDELEERIEKAGGSTREVSTVADYVALVAAGQSSR